MRLTHLERQAVHWGVLLLPFLVGFGTLLLFAEVIRPFFSIIAMFFVAWILAFLLDAIVSWILDRVPTLPRGLLAALVFIVIVVLLIVSLVLVASSVLSSLTNILGDTDSVEDAITRLVTPLQQQIIGWGIQVDLEGAVNSAYDQLQAGGQAILDEVLAGGVLLFTQGTAIIFIAVVMVANKGRFLRFGQRLVPPGRESLWDDVAAATTRSFGGFVRGQFGIAALYGVVVGIIAFFFGVPFVALIAVVTAALQTIPYFGQLISWAPLFLTALVFAPTTLVPVTICLVIGLLVIQNVVSPRVLGSAVGMNPILVLAAVFVGAQVAGALGGVFGVPVLAVFVTLFNAWLDQVRPPAAIDAARDRPLLPSEGGEKVGQEAILEAAEEEGAKARAKLEEARDRIEKLEAELEGRPVRHRDTAGPPEEQPSLASKDGEIGDPEARMDAAEQEAMRAQAELDEARERIAELEARLKEREGRLPAATETAAKETA
jgi:predicted PurR-regulated permease PerM